MKAIGIMSGTSCDGADAVLLDLPDGVGQRGAGEVLGHAYEPFDAALQAELSRPMSLSVKRLAELNVLLPEIYARAVQKLSGWQQAQCCGMHGQTVWHQPPSHGQEVSCTLQIGSTAVLAQRLGMPVVGDFRGADIALGGEGAPISPLAHWFFTPPQVEGRCVVNIGGIANITWVGARAEDVRAGDVGPGGMMLDAVIQRGTGGASGFDVDGRWSSQGQVVQAVVDHIMAAPFFARPHPRTTGREDFGTQFVEGIWARFGELPLETLASSVLEATAVGIVQGITQMAPPGALRELVATGGGARNPTLISALERLLGPDVSVVVPKEGPLAASVHEPAAMALLAARTLQGLPGSLPAVTGARQGAVLGHIHR